MRSLQAVCVEADDAVEERRLARESKGNAEVRGVRRMTEESVEEAEASGEGVEDDIVGDAPEKGQHVRLGDGDEIRARR